MYSLPSEIFFSVNCLIIELTLEPPGDWGPWPSSAGESPRVMHTWFPESRAPLCLQLHIYRLSPPSSAVVFTVEETSHVCGPTQFKPILFKGQLGSCWKWNSIYKQCFHVYKYIKYITLTFLSLKSSAVLFQSFTCNNWQKILDVDLQTDVGIKCFKKLHNAIFCSEYFENFLFMVGRDFRRGTAFFSVPNKWGITERFWLGLQLA